MSFRAGRMPGASIRSRTTGNGPPCSGWKTNVVISPSGVVMSTCSSIMRATLAHRRRAGSPTPARLLGEALQAVERVGGAVVVGDGARPHPEDLVGLRADHARLDPRVLVVPGKQVKREVTGRVLDPPGMERVVPPVVPLQL